MNGLRYDWKKQPEEVGSGQVIWPNIGYCAEQNELSSS